MDHAESRKTVYCLTFSISYVFGERIERSLCRFILNYLIRNPSVFSCRSLNVTVLK